MGSDIDRLASDRGAWLRRILGLNPSSVLEIGPGAGFFSRMICEYKSVLKYTALDVGDAFLKYIEERAKIINKPEGFEASYICDDVCNLISLPDKYELIVILSAVHRIPDRYSLFTLLKRHLSPGGRIVCYEPSHYLPRVFSFKANDFKGLLAIEVLFQ